MAEGAAQTYLLSPASMLPENSRIHSVSIHTGIVGKPSAWRDGFHVGWEQCQASIQQLQALVTGHGFAFVAAAMEDKVRPEPDRTGLAGYRCSKNFVSSSLVALDVDSGLSIPEFTQHPLFKYCVFAYTSPSHSESNHRFRALFALPELITCPRLYREITLLLIEELGSDKNCNDCCRLFYGNPGAGIIVRPRDVDLPQDYITRAADRLESHSKPREAHDVSDLDIEKATYLFDHVLEPTDEGSRDRFLKISMAAASAGDALIEPWRAWAYRCHQGKSKRQTSDAWFHSLDSYSVTLASIWMAADNENPNWRRELPDHLKSSGGGGFAPHATAVGYSHGSFTDDEDELPPARVGMRTQSLFDPAFTAVATAVLPNVAPPETDFDPDPPDDEDDIPVVTLTPSKSPSKSPRKSTSTGGSSRKNQIEAAIPSVFPRLRRNVLFDRIETLDPGGTPSDVKADYAYLDLSGHADVDFPKQLCWDLVRKCADQNRFNPVLDYLEHCKNNVQPHPGFDQLADTILGAEALHAGGVPVNPSRNLANDIICRALIAAVARCYRPGCVVDWMPILVGNQNCGKSSFWRLLTPCPAGEQDRYPLHASLNVGIRQLLAAAHNLHCGWLVTIDECDRWFKEEDVENLKNLISTPEDYSSKKYENQSNYPRNFILVGTTNNKEFLLDPTGNRRFMPLVVNGVVSTSGARQKQVDLDRLRRERDSIWSAAVQRFEQGENYNWSQHELEVTTDYKSMFTEDNALIERVETIVSKIGKVDNTGRRYVTSGMVLGEMGVGDVHWKPVYRDVAKALRALGWAKGKRFINSRCKISPWYPPTDPL